MDTTGVDEDAVRGRLRSVASLLAVLLVLGLLAAAIVGTLTVAVTVLLDRALG